MDSVQKAQERLQRRRERQQCKQGRSDRDNVPKPIPRGILAGSEQQQQQQQHHHHHHRQHQQQQQHQQVHEIPPHYPLQQNQRQPQEQANHPTPFLLRQHQRQPHEQAHHPPQHLPQHHVPPEEQRQNLWQQLGRNGQQLIDLVVHTAWQLIWPVASRLILIWIFTMLLCHFLTPANLGAFSRYLLTSFESQVRIHSGLPPSISTTPGAATSVLDTSSPAEDPAAPECIFEAAAHTPALLPPPQPVFLPHIDNTWRKIQYLANTYHMHNSQKQITTKATDILGKLPAQDRACSIGKENDELLSPEGLESAGMLVADSGRATTSWQDFWSAVDSTMVTVKELDDYFIALVSGLIDQERRAALQLVSNIKKRSAASVIMATKESEAAAEAAAAAAAAGTAQEQYWLAVTARNIFSTYITPLRNRIVGCKETEQKIPTPDKRTRSAAWDLTDQRADKFSKTLSQTAKSYSQILKLISKNTTEVMAMGDISRCACNTIGLFDEAIPNSDKALDKARNDITRRHNEGKEIQKRIEEEAEKQKRLVPRIQALLLPSSSRAKREETTAQYEVVVRSNSLAEVSAREEWSRLSVVTLLLRTWHAAVLQVCRESQISVATLKSWRNIVETETIDLEQAQNRVEKLVTSLNSEGSSDEDVVEIEASLRREAESFIARIDSIFHSE